MVAQIRISPKTTITTTITIITDKIISIIIKKIITIIRVNMVITA
jgi:hypothetical protein